MLNNFKNIRQKQKKVRKNTLLQPLERGKSHPENLEIYEKNCCCLHCKNEWDTVNKALVFCLVAKNVHCSENARASADKCEEKERALRRSAQIAGCFSLVKSCNYEG